MTFVKTTTTKTQQPQNCDRLGDEWKQTTRCPVYPFSWSVSYCFSAIFQFCKLQKLRVMQMMLVYRNESELCPREVQMILSHCLMKLVLPMFIHSSWPPELIPSSGSCEECCHEHWLSVWVPAFHSWIYTWSQIAGLYGGSLCNFLNYWWMGFHRSCTILCSHQLLHICTAFYFPFFKLQIWSSISPWFSCWASFCVLSSQLSVFFEVSIHVLYSFLSWVASAR